MFDFATIPERRADQAHARLRPGRRCRRTREQQQACVSAVAATDGYNWGYDPLHYTVPEGSYAADPDGPRGPTSSARWSPGSTAPGCGW